jgi:hypothetical protein
MLDALTRALGLYDFLPKGPVLTPRQRVDLFGRERGSGVEYGGPARVSAPIMPLQLFGVGYDADLMLVSDHPDWNMHEYAMLSTPDGPVWLAKDAREETLEQSIVAEQDDLEHWLPEVTVRRKWSRVTVDDRSTSKQIDLSLAYENIDGEPTEVTWRGPHPSRLQRLRNTSTMGHSRDAFLVVLDLSHKAPARKASITINGQKRKIHRMFGLVPMQFALVQTQAGVAVGEWSQSATPGGFETIHHQKTRQAWTLSDHGTHVVAQQRHPMRTLSYRFLRQGDALELVHARVEQYARSVPVCEVRFDPALPDFRRPFSGTFEGRYVIDVNGQQSHATGRTLARDEAGVGVLSILPNAPHWTTDRPMQATITCGADVATVCLKRVGAPPASEPAAAG